MRHLKVAALALLAPCTAFAQQPAYPPIVAPSTVVPPHAVAWRDADGTTRVASPSTPLPVTTSPPSGPSSTNVQGVDSSGTTATAKPVGVAGVYTSATALPTMTVGARTDLVTDVRGNLRSLLVGTSVTPDSSRTMVVLVQSASTNSSSSTGAGPLATLGYVWDGVTTTPAAGSAAGTFVVGKGGASIATAQVSVGTTATLIAASRAGRQKIGVTVTTAVQCAFGNAGVTLATGWPLAAIAYASDSWDTAAALYGVCASTATVGAREQF